MKRILVPTDFSEQAENALKIAVQLAKKYKSEIFLLHSVEMPLHLATKSHQEMPESLFYIKVTEQRFAELKENPFLSKVELN